MAAPLSTTQADEQAAATAARRVSGAGGGVPVLTLRRERLESLEAARPFDTVRALMDEAARLAAGKGGGVCPSSGAASGAIAGTV